MSRFVRFEHYHTKKPIFVNVKHVRYVYVSDKTAEEASLVDIQISDEDCIRVVGPIERVINELRGTRTGRSD